VSVVCVYEPGDPGGDPVAVYRGVHAIKNGEGSTVFIDRWGPQWPIGHVSRLVTWDAWMTVPKEGMELVAKDIRTKKLAVEKLVEVWHFRYRARKSWEHKPSRPPVKSRWDLLPPGIPWGERNEVMGQLHRFLGVNRRLFDAPLVIREYDGWPYPAEDIEANVRPVYEGDCGHLHYLECDHPWGAKKPRSKR